MVYKLISDCDNTDRCVPLSAGVIGRAAVLTKLTVEIWNVKRATDDDRT